MKMVYKLLYALFLLPVSDVHLRQSWTVFGQGASLCTWGFLLTPGIESPLAGAERKEYWFHGHSDISFFFSVSIGSAILRWSAHAQNRLNQREKQVGRTKGEEVKKKGDGNNVKNVCLSGLECSLSFILNVSQIIYDFFPTQFLHIVRIQKDMYGRPSNILFEILNVDKGNMNKMCATEK